MQQWDSILRDNQRKTLLYLFFTALGVQILFLSQYAASPFFHVPRLDAHYHDLMARQILGGQLPSEPFFRAPLYGYFLAGIYLLAGEQNFWAVRLVQAILGSCSVLLLYTLGTRMFRPTTGLIAAVTMAFYGPLVFLQSDLHTPVLEVFLDLAFLSLLWLGRDSPRRNLMVALSGICLGLSAITRPNVLVVLPLVLWWFGARQYRQAGVFALCALLFPALVTARNGIVGGDPVFIASQGGINLYLGNRPGADGFTPSTPSRYRFDSEYVDSVALYGQRAAEEASGRRLKPSESDRYWTGQALRFWTETPMEALRLFGKKVTLALSNQEVRNNLAFDYVRSEWTPLLHMALFGFWYAGPFGIVGVALAWRQHPETRLFALFAALYTLSFVMFFVADRYRLPIVPVLLMFAAHAVVCMIQWARGRQAKRMTAPAIALVALLLFVNIPWFPTTSKATLAQDIWSAGNRYLALGKAAEAEPHLRRALALNDTLPEYWSSLGEALYYQKRFPDAASAFARALRLAPDDPGLYYNLSLCAQEMGRLHDARQLLAEALRRDPTYERARTALATLAR